MRYRYHAFGLHLHSEIPLEGLRGAAADAAPDVTIEQGRIAKGKGWIAEERVFRSDIPRVATYEVRPDGRIIVAAYAGSDPENVQRALLGKIMALVAYQRGEMPVHAATVVADGRLVAFAGDSGRGKSTLAAALARLGYEVVGDDLLLLRTAPDRPPEGMPGTVRLRLDRDALALAAGATPSPDKTAATAHKTYVAIPKGSEPRMRPLAAVYQLEWGSPSIERLGAADRVGALPHIMHMWRFREKLGDPERIRRAAFALITRVPLFRLRRPRQASEFNAGIAAIEAHLKDLLPNARAGGEFQPRNISGKDNDYAQHRLARHDRLTQAGHG